MKAAAFGRAMREADCLPALGGARPFEMQDGQASGFVTGFAVRALRVQQTAVVDVALLDATRGHSGTRLA
jgi:hypothetical protein